MTQKRDTISFSFKNKSKLGIAVTQDRHWLKIIERNIEKGYSLYIRLQKMLLFRNICSVFSPTLKRKMTLYVPQLSNTSSTPSLHSLAILNVIFNIWWHWRREICFKRRRKHVFLSKHNKNMFLLAIWWMRLSICSRLLLVI